MSATEIFRFGCFTLRPATLADYPLAAEWTRQDPAHHGKLDPLTWIRQGARIESYLLKDQGWPVFFFHIEIVDTKVAPAVRMRIQFPPAGGDRNLRDLVLQGIIEGIAWLEPYVRAKGIRTIFFNSENPSLVRFCVKRLGFTQNGRLLMKGI